MKKNILLAFLGFVVVTTAVLAYFLLPSNGESESAHNAPPVAELSAEQLAIAEAAKKFELLRQHADEGQLEAQKKLATAYSEGRGTKKDIVQGKMWWNIVAMAGNKSAVEKRDALRGKMSMPDITQADRLTWAWLSNHPIQHVQSK